MSDICGCGIVIGLQTLKAGSVKQSETPQTMTRTIPSPAPKGFKMKEEILKKLKELWLHNNQLNKLPNWIDNLTNLENLSIDNNQIKSLPESIKKLASTLKKLYLGDNPVWNNQKEMKKIKSWLPNTKILED